MTTPRALVLTVTALVLSGCAGTRQMPTLDGEGGRSSTAGTGGVTGSGGTAVTTSHSGGSTGGGDIGLDGSGGGANCGLYHFQPMPKNADIMMVLDRSGSMKDLPDGAPSGSSTKWQIVAPAMQQIVTATDSAISWGLKTFPEAYTDSMSDCAGGITKAIDVQMAGKNGSVMNTTISATTPNGKGTPTSDAVTAAANYLKTVSDANPKYLLLATDGEPDCIGTSKDSSRADPASVTAVADALAAGFPTFVVGIATTKTSSNTELNMLAQAGGAGIPSTNPLASHYYLANDAATLQSALQAITGQISSCLFPLSAPPPVPNDATKAGVYLGSNMMKIPYDAGRSSGWAYVDSADSAIQVFGSWCSMIQADGAGAVQIVFGCPNIDVP